MNSNEIDLISLSLDEKAELFVSYVFGGLHRVRKLERASNHYVCIPHGTLATYDDDRLTRVVLASHRYGLRAEVDNHGMRGIKILLHNRKSRTGRIFERHPMIADVVSNEDKVDAHQLLHRLWSACVDKPGYKKLSWKEVEAQLKTAGAIK